MTLQRANPIPPGVYWIDVIDQADKPDFWGQAFFLDIEEKKDAAFRKWLGANRSSVTVLKKEVQRGNPLSWDNFSSWGTDAGPYIRTWWLFKVTRPTSRWPASAGLGLPTIAPRGEKQTEASTSTEKEVITKIEQEHARKWQTLAVAVGVLWFLSRR